ncbi:radical SAM protein [Bacillus marinisedimentorum]|uniref:radical SAM protein n=1 Tax=Bacillus marinisedimentorum TaxID=1821260 RepID=UPI000871DCAD|nr:radical SAM protein [Bacillus marinisedimentorum]
MGILTRKQMEHSRNKALLNYLDIYDTVEKSTLKHIEQFGLPFENESGSTVKENRVRQLKENGAFFRNNDKSILNRNRISSACEACQTGTGSYTSFVSLKCHRDCYFCFNKNQDNYHFYLQHTKNVNGELESILNQGTKLTHLALTGGEPLLHAEEAISFFELANRRAPGVHTRLYTAGDLLTEEILQRLKDAGLNEIRFSIKMEDQHSKQKHILRQIGLAKKYIPDVLVEMPVIPGTGEAMKELLCDLEELGIFGINLLEFCFPLENPKPFKDRGFSLKNPPYEVYYNFWYAGGLAVAESEALCHELVQFAIEQDFEMGVHYCSLENKFTGQIYQQNHDQTLDATYTFSQHDYYFKTAKVFGKDKRSVRKTLEKRNMPFIDNTEYDFLQFSVEAIPLLRHKDIDVIISSNVIETARYERSIKEVNLELADVKEFELARI